MGQDWRPNKAISVELVTLTLQLAELRALEAPSLNEQNWWLVFHTYVTVCYAVSLRGCKGFLLDLTGLHRKFDAGGTRYVVIALLGKIKGESDDRDHLLPCVPMTSSGVDVQTSVARLMEFKQAPGHVSGPAISDINGRVFLQRVMNDALLEVLEELFESHRELFPPSISSKEILRQRVQVFRTLRRTSDA
jgi:hypothetical protein